MPKHFIKTILVSLSLWSSFAHAGNLILVDSAERARENAQLQEWIAANLTSEIQAETSAFKTGSRNSFRFFYWNMSNLIDSCLNDSQCVRTENERQALALVQNVLLGKSFALDNLFFLSGPQYLDFFKDENSHQRLAKTGFSPDFPILINEALVSDRRLESQLSFPIGILFHELGHQAGMASHSFLDGLGAKLRVHFEKVIVRYSSPDSSSPFRLLSFPKKGEKTLSFYLASEGEYFRFPVSLKCSQGEAQEATLLTFRYLDIKGTAIPYFDFEFDAQLVCLNSSKGESSVERQRQLFRLIPSPQADEPTKFSFILGPSSEDL